MVSQSTKSLSFYDLTFEELKNHLTLQNHSSFVASQLFHWAYKKKVQNIALWSNVSKKMKEHLLENFSFELPKHAETQISSDRTTKFLMELQDGEKVEAVLIPMGEQNERLTLCLSSQVGCAMKCSFCFTGTQGLTRNLKCSEIIGEYLLASKWIEENPDSGFDHITNIVFMGQGEPLHNFEEVKKSIQLLMDAKGIGIGQRKITLSTSGLVPQLKKLKDFPPVNLAISLHSPRNEIRNDIMPINRKYNLEELKKALSEVPLKSFRRITYEYLLIDGLTNTPLDIELLRDLIPRDRSKINLIPFNEFPGSKFLRPSDEKNLWFCEELTSHGYTCTIRQSKGRDILAACGQLKNARAPLKFSELQTKELLESSSLSPQKAPFFLPSFEPSFEASSIPHHPKKVLL